MLMALTFRAKLLLRMLKMMIIVEYAKGEVNCCVVTDRV